MAIADHRKIDPHQKAKRELQTIANFRGLSQPEQFYTLPEIPSRRKLTDVAFLIALSICLILLGGLLIYTVGFKSDIQRLIHGYDNCGNVCGAKNERVDGIDCSGVDMTDKPFLKIIQTLTDENYNEFTLGECVTECASSEYEEFNRCWNDSYDAVTYGSAWPGLNTALSENSGKLAGLCCFALAISVGGLMILRYFTDVFIYTMVTLFVLLFWAIAGVFWYFWSQDASITLTGPIVFTIIALIFSLVMLALMSRIKLLILLVKEAVKIVFSMPLILLEPVLTIAAQIISIGLFVYIIVLFTTAGDLQKIPILDNPNELYLYVQNGTMIFTLVLAVVMYVWMLQFMQGCQQMVISGAVAAGYFTNDKLTLISPIYNSFYNLVRFHLGSVAFGSFAITVIEIFKAMVRAASRNNFGGQLCLCLLRPIENLVRYLTSMGYIVIAIHGQSLCKSGARALNLVLSNYLTSVAVNSVGGFVFFTVKLVIVLLTIGLGAGILAVDSSYNWLIILIGACVAFLCAHCFFVVIEIALDTIYICYCEDQEVNDGRNNPYYTTLDLQNYLSKAQALELQQAQKKNNKKK